MLDIVRYLMVLVVAFSMLLAAEANEAVCGYKSCPANKANVINVHLVPHSHDDLGWLKTVDQYYYGSRNGVQRAGVANILDTVVQELLKDPTRRFIYSEMAYFFKWYHDQNEKVKKDVSKLVNEGRLEFVGGGWSANDEATVHYQSIIDQYTLGLQEIYDHFGHCGRPRVAWQIDPFGHSNEMASIFAQMGYDGEFFARLDWVEKSKRMGNLEGEMVWKSSESLEERADIFTSILYNHYSAPPGFCFDTLCVDEPIIDGQSYDNNVEERIDEFIAYITHMSEKYHTTDLLVPMGDDFNYENALINFKNMDKLIKYTNIRQNNGSRIHLFYSTPSCYLKSLHEKKTNWPMKKLDFFPYSTDMHSYWTGYYTSRPTLKRFERQANHFLQVVKQLAALAKTDEIDLLANVDQLRKMMGIMQHHDAITGTHKQHVTNDYVRLLTDAIHAGQHTAHVSLQKLTNLTTGEFQSCLLLNISVCHATRFKTNDLVLTLVNPLAHRSTQYIRLPVKNNTYIVMDSTYTQIPTQIVPVPKQVAALPFRSNETDAELVFEATVDKVANYYIKAAKKDSDSTDLPKEDPAVPARFQPARPRKVRAATTTTTAAPDNNTTVAADAKPTPPASTTKESKTRGRTGMEIKLENSLIKLLFGKSGHLMRIEMNGISENVRQEFFYYKASEGANWPPSRRGSGAYIFRPNSTEVPVSTKVYSYLHEGTLVKEVHQYFTDWISQVVRIYEGVNRIEFEWMVGPIPVKDGVGKEVISRFTTNINTSGIFWTDSNGREMLRRVLNEREYYKPSLKEKVSSNYYPVTNRISLDDTQKRFTVFTDRAEGGSSLQNGSVELLLHRRLLQDDAFGLGEPLNETAYNNSLIVRGKMYVILSAAKQKPSYYERLAQKEIQLPFWKFFSNSSRQVSIDPLVNFTYIPNEIELLTLEVFGPNQYLLRLENIMDKTETPPVTFNIREIFDGLSGEEIRETTLDGSMALEDMRRFKFATRDSEVPKKLEYYHSKHVPLVAKKTDPATSFVITLDPMQIRTFVIKYASTQITNVY